MARGPTCGLSVPQIVARPWMSFQRLSPSAAVRSVSGWLATVYSRRMALVGVFIAPRRKVDGLPSQRVCTVSKELDTPIGDERVANLLYARDASIANQHRGR